MTKISFSVKIYTIEDWLIVHLPSEASKKLPSRGLVMGNGTLNGQPFTAPLEPDGRGGHWFNINQALRTLANVQDGDNIEVTIQPATDWPRPETPTDLAKALKKAPKAQAVWDNVTPKAQWEWLRWIRSTKQAGTRARRVDVAISKMNSGMRRPCCFNSAMCTETNVAKNGVLLEPIHVQ